jgi:hypothetical protein
VHVLSVLWQRVTATQPAPARTVILAAAAVALVVVGARRPWGIARHAITLVHEASHGIAAVAGGRRLAGIRLHHDTSGVTLSKGRPTGPGMVTMLAAGYLGPAVIGLAAAATLASGHAVGLLWCLLVLLVLLLLQIRNLFGLWSVLATGAVVFVVSWWLPGRAQTEFAAFVTWLLLLGAPRPLLELIRTRRRRPGALMSDPDQLARITPLPAGAWLAAMLAGTAGALAGGAALLLGT